MPIIANTFQTTAAKGNRETLHDIATQIDPEDTPIYSMATKVSFSGTHPEWETTSLSTPADNSQLEGDEYTFAATPAAVRVGNYTQILRKDGIISTTQEAVDNAGRAEQLRAAKMNRAIELRKDVEFSIVAANASVAGATRKSASLASWITSNVNRGASGTNGGFNSGTGLVAAAGPGTQRAFTKTLLDGVMQQGYVNGANFRHLVVSPYVKSVFVTFMSDTNVAAFRYAASSGKDNSIVANADIYEGPFGKVIVQPNRVMATSATTARNALLIDPDHLKWGWLRKIKSDNDVAKTGDAEKFVIIGEGALKIDTEKGMGAVADVFGLTAAS